jgi:hypothetical protein
MKPALTDPLSGSIARTVIAAAYRAGQLAEHLHAHSALIAVLIPATVITATITRLRSRRGVSRPGYR